MIDIENYRIGAGRAFVIAEIGNNHNGSFERAIEMVDQAAAMGADCAKFQMRHLDEIYRQRTLRRDGDAYAARLREAGVEVWHDVTPRTDHYFLTEDPVRARTTMARVADEVAAALA